MITTFKILLTGLLLSIASPVATAQVRSEYYAVLPFWESPITPFKGACPISAREASTQINLQLDYDKHNRVVAARIQLGNHLKDFEGFFGHLYINAPLTRVAYEENREIHRFYDRFENPIAVMGGVFTKVYEKDTRGRNIRLSFETASGDKAADSFGVVEYRWQYSPDGHVIEVRIDASGKPVALRGEFGFMRTRMSFGPDGYVSRLENIDEDGTPVELPSGAASYNYYYTPQGRFDRWEVFDKDGLPATGPSHTAGEQNSFEGCYLSDIVFFDQEGGPAIHWSGAEIWHFETDAFGNTISVTFLDRYRNPINGPNNYAERRFKWSEDGRHLLSQSYFDATGSPAVHKELGYHRMEHIRDSLGLIQETLFKDSLGRAVNRADTGEARQIFLYDQKHKLLSYRSYDASGSLLN